MERWRPEAEGNPGRHYRMSGAARTGVGSLIAHAGDPAGAPYTRPMQAAIRIREAVARVGDLHRRCAAEPSLDAALHEVKRFQAQRFAGTYADLLDGGSYAPAARFFLEELYSDRDYRERDAQFARIAGALERLFPEAVVATAVALADLHALTESLDTEMALAWHGADGPPVRRYHRAWTAVGQRTLRDTQLREVLAMGEDLARLTRTPGLRLMLRMMRGPAQAAGLGALQHFLERGFDTFAAMARARGQVEGFLGLIREREARLIAVLFEESSVACETELARILGQAR